MLHIRETDGRVLIVTIETVHDWLFETLKRPELNWISFRWRWVSFLMKNASSVFWNLKPGRRVTVTRKRLKLAVHLMKWISLRHVAFVSFPISRTSLQVISRKNNKLLQLTTELNLASFCLPSFIVIVSRSWHLQMIQSHSLWFGRSRHNESRKPRLSLPLRNRRRAIDTCVITRQWSLPSK